MNKLKKTLFISLLTLIPATLLVSAQDSKDSTEASTETAAPAKQAPLKKQPKKKVTKKTKKSPPKPDSEYIFKQVDSIPTYRFDKKANPIIKEIKAKKKPARSATGTPPQEPPPPSGPRQKLKPKPPIDAGDQEKPPDQEGQ
ncbi:MAG: hypothetical protein WCK75_03345 [Elusimicrobiota bacterium]